MMLRPAAAAEADCRELEQKYNSTRPGITSIELNAILFASAAKDCGALARRLIAAGASLQARDRTGAMPLAHAARRGHAALVARLLAEGAAIDARDLNGSTALYADAQAERPGCHRGVGPRRQPGGANPEAAPRGRQLRRLQP